MSDTNFIRHPELVSGSISGSTLLAQHRRWMLKQVQHDDIAAEAAE